MWYPFVWLGTGSRVPGNTVTVPQRCDWCGTQARLRQTQGTMAELSHPGTKARLMRLSSVDMADAAIERIRNLQAGIARRLSSSESVMQSSQTVVDSCGDTILQWFGSLSGTALETAIREAFEKFDTDCSGVIDREEFASSMHALGLRLSTEQYDTLFQQVDIDGSGGIDLAEFMAMVKKFMAPGNKPSEIRNSNLYDSYRSKWANDETVLIAAATTIKDHAVSALSRQTYVGLVEQQLDSERFAEQQAKFYNAWREVVTEEQCMKMTLDYKDTPELLQKQQQEKYFGTDYTVRYSESTTLSF